MEKRLREFCLAHRVAALWGAPLSDYTSFRIGGVADAFLLPDTERELLGLLHFLSTEAIPHRVIGNGTNLLVADRGFRGAVVSTRHIRGISVSGCSVRAAAGTPLGVLCRTLADHSLDGLAPLYGIPGTVGGAIVMNAGAFGATVSDHLCYASVYDTADDTVKTLSPKDLDFSYRHSALLGRREAVLLSAEFSFPPSDSEKIREKMRQVLLERMQKQPTALPCAGSAFLKPSTGYAAEWIERAGLSGYRIGGAAVSVKHTGFIVNLGGATASDVLALIGHIQNEVQTRFGIELVPEIEYVE